MNKFSMLMASLLIFISMSANLHSQTVIDCAAGHANFTYCYTSNDTTSFVFTNTSGLPLNLMFNAGEVENGFDEVIVIDTDGVTDLNAATPYGNNGNLTGLTFQSSGDTITLMIDSDSVIDCQSNGFTEWDWDVWCQTCLDPTVSFETDNCAEGEDFNVLVDVQDLGTAATLTISDDQGSPQQNVTETGIVTFGPYAPNTIVVITVENADDTNCILMSNGISCLSGIFEIDDSLSTQELVEDVLFNSSCVELSNFSQSTGTDFGDVNGIGAFNANGADFPFQEGLILTSGDVLQTPGPNLDLLTDGGFDWPGDLDLEANTTATETNNASWVQFDFVPLIDQISFNFILASEEYNQNFECTYSDAFAFIVTDQVTGDVQNLAVLPGTNIPIEVTNIRPDVPGQCSAVNEEYFDKYNFAPFNPEEDATIDYNGQILSLQAIGDVVVGNPYTIKLVIADETDTAYDSAVFIEAGSFDIGNVDLGADILIANGDAICEGEVITLDAGSVANATYQWYKDGVELVGETNSTLDVTVGGLYSVEVAFEQAPGCLATDEILIEFLKNPVFDLGPDQLVCDNASIVLDATVENPLELLDITYTWFLNGTEIVGETNPTITITDSGVYSVEVSGNGCIVTDEVNVTLVAFDVDLGNDISVCDITSVDLTTTITGQDPLDATYLWNTGDTTQNITVTQSGSYTVEVTIEGCVNTDTVEVNLGTTPSIELGSDIETCLINPEILDATPSNNPVQNFVYQWSLNGTVLTGETNALLTANSVGTYTVIVNDGICSSEDTIVLSPANDIDIELGENFETCFENQIVLDASPSNYDPSLASYEWSLNGTVISGANNATLIINEVGDYSVTVTYNVCTTQDSISVNPRADLEVTVGNDFRTCPNETYTLSATTSETNVTYQWYLNSEMLPNETESDITVTIEEDTFISQTYSVILTKGICTGTNEIEISLYDNENCVITQGISPNNDNQNDNLDLEYLNDKFGINKISIFNRHGVLVYEKNNYVNEWYGQTNDGDELPTGTYYYIIELNTENPISDWIYINK